MCPSLMSCCGNRFHVFDNTNKARSQVVELIKKIDDMVAGNGGTHYSDAMYKEVQSKQMTKGSLSADQNEDQYSFSAALFERIKQFLFILSRE